MKFSLIMGTLGRRDEVCDMLESLDAQSYRDFELIIVDQNPDDRLVDVVVGYRQKFAIKHIRTELRGLSRARNLGIEHATGAVLCFPDDDCKYYAGYLAYIVEIFSSSSVDGITGSPSADPNGTLSGDSLKGAVLLTRTSLLNRCQEFTFAIRREALGDLCFNDRLGVGAGTLWGSDEGPDLMLRIMEQGRDLYYFSRLYVFHPNKVDLPINRKSLELSASYARGHGCLLRMHHYPLTFKSNVLIRATGGIFVYLMKCRPAKARYYVTVLLSTLRGLLMSRRELAEVRSGATSMSRIRAWKPIQLPQLSERPLVSVIVANFNYASFLPSCMASLSRQTYEHWEAIVCDDGSTDDSLAILKRLAAADPRIKVFPKSNGGQCSAVNHAAARTTGAVICFLDSDDQFDPDKIESIVDAFRAHPQAGVCTHYLRVVDSDGAVILDSTPNTLDAGWLADTAFERGGCVNVPVTSGMAFRADVARALMPIAASLQRDADGYLFMAAQFLTPFVSIPRALASYRVHGKNMGGLIDLTIPRLRHELRLIQNRTCALIDFLRSRAVELPEISIDLRDNPQFVQSLLKLRALGDDVETSEEGPTIGIIRRHPSRNWRILWRLIFLVPISLRSKLLQAAGRSHKMKSFLTRRLARATRGPMTLGSDQSGQPNRKPIGSLQMDAV